MPTFVYAAAEESSHAPSNRRAAERAPNRPVMHEKATPARRHRVLGYKSPHSHRLAVTHPRKTSYCHAEARAYPAAFRGVFLETLMPHLFADAEHF